MQPGDTITPKDQSDDDTKPTPEQSPINESKPEPTSPTPGATETTEASPWQYSGDDSATSYQQHALDLPPVNWTASEFIDHEKNASWFMTLGGITGLAVVVIYLITQDLITAFVIIIAAALFGVTAKRKPRTLQYQIDHSGVNIGGKPYPYDLFKSFAVLAEGAFNSIQLMPLKRFMPPISLYYPPESEDQIVTMLGNYLPHEERTHDPVDRLMRRIRF